MFGPNPKPVISSKSAPEIDPGPADVLLSDGKAPEIEPLELPLGLEPLLEPLPVVT